MNDKKLFPSIKPYKSGYLKVKSGHSIYWEISGNPDSIPLLFLHGGPGASCHPIYRRFFNPNKFKIILTQGLNRQIRRMCEYLNYRVVKLKRVRIMNINLDLDIGKYRLLSGSELKKLNNLTENSSKEFN